MNEDSDLEIGEHDRGNPLAAEIEDAPNIYREAALKANLCYTKMFIYIQEHRQNLAFVWDCCLLVMEKYRLLGVDNQVALASRHNVDKAHVSATVKEIQRRTGLITLSQRNLEGCKKMSKKRKEGLKK